jgi:leader peptidase (prepilin peptidase)/N-methyltransferase
LQYPLVELTTATMFLAVFSINFSDEFSTTEALAEWLSLLNLLIFVATTVVLGVIDIRHMRLPSRFILIGLISALALGLAVSGISGDWDSYIGALMGAAIFFVPLWSLSVFYPKGMGRGDANLAALLGFQLGLLGLQFLFVGIFLGFAIGAVWGIGLMVIAKATRKSVMPLGQALILGSWVSLVFGGEIWTAYLGLSGIFP